MAEPIKLLKPLVFFDIEATGVSPSEDRIVDIALVKRLPDGSEEAFSSLVNPEMPIPLESQAIHHITDAMVKDAPTFKKIGLKLLEFIGEADLGGFNVLKFDIPMLSNEFRRAGFPFLLDGRAIVDSMTIYHRMEPRSLGAAVKFYCGKPLEDAHRAEPDARASLEVFFAQTERYPELPRSIEALGAYCTEKPARNVDAEGKFVWRNGKAAFNFGKYRTVPLDEVVRKEPGYLKWLADGDRTSAEMAKICRDALVGIFPVKTEEPVKP